MKYGVYTPPEYILDPTIKNVYEQTGRSIGRLVDKKNAQYGDSFNKSGEFLKILYPNGIKPDQYTDMLGIVRVFDKMMRIANGNQGDENAWQDITGYGILRSERSQTGEPSNDTGA